MHAQFCRYDLWFKSLTECTLSSLRIHSGVQKEELISKRFGKNTPILPQIIIFNLKKIVKDPLAPAASK